MDITIRGALITRSFVHQTSPSGKGDCMKTSVIGMDGHLLSSVPYVTANSVRGLLRRAAGQIILDGLKAHHERIHRDLYLSIVRGSYARSGIALGKSDYMQMVKAAQHVFAGLFGGGAQMYRSTVRMESDLLPITVGLAHLFPLEVQSIAIEVAHPRDLIEKTMMAPRDDFAALPPIAREIVEDVDTAYTDYMLQKQANSDQVKAAKSEGKDKVVKDDLNNFLADIECIIPGVPLYFGLTAPSINEAQAGLLLKAVELWANRNVLGGGAARGRGRFQPILGLTVDNQVITPNMLVGDVPHLQLEDNETIQQCLQALEDALQTDATRQSIMDIYGLPAGASGKDKNDDED